MFYYNYNNKIYNGSHYMTDDTSIIFKYSDEINLMLDYTISLGGNPRFLIDVFHKTGKCGPLRCFMAGIKVIQKELNIPQSKRGELYFKSNEKMVKYGGTIYRTFQNSCYYDKNNNTLCIGNPEQKGEIIEFAENTYASIYQNELTAIFIKVDCIEANIVKKKKYILFLHR